MNLERLSLFTFLASAFICRGQEIPTLGWFNAGRSIDAIDVATNAPSEEGSGPPHTEGLTPTIAETITPEIQALARGLENDPKRIYD